VHLAVTAAKVRLFDLNLHAVRQELLIFQATKLASLPDLSRLLLDPSQIPPYTLAVIISGTMIAPSSAS
jgi:hypothetical protein